MVARDLCAKLIYPNGNTAGGRLAIPTAHPLRVDLRHYGFSEHSGIGDKNCKLLSTVSLREVGHPNFIVNDDISLRGEFVFAGILIATVIKRVIAIKVCAREQNSTLKCCFSFAVQSRIFNGAVGWDDNSII